MNVIKLADLLLSPEDQHEMECSLTLLAQGDDAAFYEKNPDIIQSILFLETLDEFLDFSSENRLDAECFCAAFLCAKGYGIQIGGYEEDLTHSLTDFFTAKGMGCAEISEIIFQEKIYTDCSDYDNFKKAMTAINRVLDDHGTRLFVLEDFVYCDCEYTVLLLEKSFADKASVAWDSKHFELFL